MSTAHTTRSDSDSLHVLILPSFYDDPDRPVLGSFFKDQAVALANGGQRVGVVYEEGRRLQALSLKNLRMNHFQKRWSEVNGVRELRRHAWNPMSQHVAGGKIWSRWMVQLAERYITEQGVPDIIHAHNCVWAGHAAVRVAAKHRAASVITEHSTSFPLRTVPPALEAPIKETLARADAVVAVSRALADSMAPYLQGKTAHIVPNVVDSDYFHLPRHDPAPSPRVFLCVAKLFEKKGIDVLLRAWASCFRGRGDVELRIGGDGPLRAQLHSLTETLEIRDNVRFLGEIKRDRVRQEMWEAHVFVLPSRFETFGVVVIEALATGLPVIATVCGGPEEILTPDLGVLLQPEDETGLAATLEQMARAPMPDRKGARQHVMSRYSAPVIAELLTDLYRQTLVDRR